MVIFQILYFLEALIINIFTTDRCCHRKYSLARTLLIFALSIVLYLSLTVFFPITGDGAKTLTGFLFLIPLKIVYREKLPVLFVIVCISWIYTQGIFSLSYQINGLFVSGNSLYVLMIQSALLLITMVPFYRWLVPKYVFINENLPAFDRHWFKYIILNSFLPFLSFTVLHLVLITEPSSVQKILCTLLWLISVYVSYYILYKIVLDSIKMHHLEQVAFHDPLTGLGNRSSLWDCLQKLTKTDRTFSVLFMDLDRFKAINDQYGHLTGDAYLKHFARISSSILRGYGTVYRFGGDEFVAVCPGKIPAAVMEQLKECKGWEDGSPCPFNQVSTGIVTCLPPHPGVEEILHQVDQMMYQNKAAKHQTSR